MRYPHRLLVPRLALADEPQLSGGSTRAEADVQVDPARQAQAKRYARQRHVVSVINLVLSAVVVAVLLFTGLGFGLRDALAGLGGWQPIAGWHPLVVAGYLVIVLAATALLGLPLSYYGGFVLPHRYGLSTQSLRSWVADDLKGSAISLPIALAAVEFTYALLALTPDSWWLWTGLAVLVFTVLLANLAPIVLVPIFYKLTPLPDGDVRTRALALAERARTRVRGIYTLNLSSKTTAANAMVMGLGNTRRIIVGDTLLERFTPDEIEVVVAHELGHQVHHDIPKLVAVEAVTTLGGLYLINLALHLVVGHVARFGGLADAATLPLLGVLLGIFGLLVLPLQNGFSRRVERQADIYALETTRNPAAFIAAMTRLANQNLAELDPSPVVEFLLHNHPSTGKRIALGRRFATDNGLSA